MDRKNFQPLSRIAYGVDTGIVKINDLENTSIKILSEILNLMINEEEKEKLKNYMLIRKLTDNRRG